MPIRPHVVYAVFLRNFSSYFSGINGFLFILVFVVGGALFAFSPLFFTENQCNLDQLTAYFPVLLLFLIPAISMGTWSEEKKQGTEELLFTLPATDFEILLGKFKAVVSVYTVALLFSLSHVFVLYLLGKPDAGILFSTYLGYWLAGICLIGPAMYASSLTNNITVAFVLGVIFCSIPIYATNVISGFFGIIDLAAGLVGISKDVVNFTPRLGLLKTLSLPVQLQYFTNGIIYLSSVLYFVSFCALFLFLNYNRIGRRQWSSDEKFSLSFQYALRALAVMLILICVTSWFWESPLRLDTTNEQFYTLSKPTTDILSNVEKDQLITIQAFISDEVPTEYLQVKKTLTGLLKEFDIAGGSKVDLRIVNVESHSKEAEEARAIGINPRSLSTEVNGEFKQLDTFMGAMVSSSYNDVLIPFFDLGVKVEYELARAIGSVSQKARKTIGIVKTDAKATGGFDMNTFRNSPEWRIVSELKKQYIVEEVIPDSPIDGDKYAVVIAIMPSSLTQPQMTNFVDYVKKGKPTLIFDDPMPIFNMEIAPSEPKPRQGGGMFGGGPPPEQKADDGKATSLVNTLGFAWKYDQIVFDRDTPEPRFKDVAPPELIFIYQKDGHEDSFNPQSPVTKGLQSMLAYFPGTITKRSNCPYEFTPLLYSGQLTSGLINKDDLLQRSMFGMAMNPNPKRINDEYRHVIAAHIETKGDSPKRNVIYVADSDIMNDNLANIAESEMYGLKIDNIVFVMNAVDFLAGNKDFIELRKKRLADRKLDTIARVTSKFIAEREDAVDKARKEGEKELEDAKKRFEEKIKGVEADESLDERAKARILRNIQETEQRTLDVRTKEIDLKRDQKVDEIKALSERKITNIKDQTRLIANLISAIPALILGFFILVARLMKEQSIIQEERLVH